VIVDLAAENGGNCELTKPGDAVVHHGVTILGYTDMASRMANVASDLYGTNLWHLLDEMGGAAGWKVDHGNDIVRGALVVQNGEQMWPPPPPKKVDPEVKQSREGTVPATVAAEPAKAAGNGHAKAKGHGHGAPAKQMPGAILVGLLIAFLGAFAAARLGLSTTHLSPETADLLQRLTVFVLAVFVGWQIVWNVTPALHTPLMSVTNAISGIIVVGGLLGGSGHLETASAVAIVAILFATINIVGGFWVTRRMLAMFRK
jgi:proton-translocating NAD(P)+ transhydrogenase subunit alpha